MGRRSLLASVAAASAAAVIITPSAAASVTGVDVLSRAQALVATTPASAPSSTATFLPLTQKDLPADVAATLAARSLSWDALSDVMRIGVLWAHGYVVAGGRTGSTSLVKVWTACSPGQSVDAAAGKSMDGIGLSKTAFAAAQCDVNTCGNFFQATNDKCSDSIASQLVCAVDATGLTVSNDSFWSDAGSDSTSVPYPQVYTHALSVANGTKTLNLVSIHMAATPSGSPRCGNTGDAIVPCLALSKSSSDRSFCRPSVNPARLGSFLDVVSKHLAESTSSTISTKSDGASKSSGLSTGAIAGIIGGAVVVLGLLAFYFFRSKKARHHAANDPEYPGFGRKSSTGPNSSGLPNPTAGFAQNHKPIHRQGTSFPLIDSSRENDTVFSSDYVGGDNALDEDSRQRPFSRRLLQSQESLTQSRSRNSSLLGSGRGMFGKSVDEYCEESEIIRDFVNDPQIKIRRIPYEELTVLRILSKGSYGEVFLGQLETRHVAMKRLLPEKKHLTKSIEQFMGEIQIMCHLEHRNIVTFVGVSWDYLQNIAVVVEYMDNGDLAEVLAKSKTKYTWPKEKISISMDIAEGLVYLHSMRPVIIHRDLKSKNVLLNKRGQAKLSDFGVSRKTTVNETMTSGVGTLLWTAPEIIEGRKYSEKADIFSLGVVLSEIDTCEEPYSTVKNEETGERLPGMQIVQMVRLGELRVNFRNDCPPKLRELAQQCTDLDPDKRPTSMEVAYTLKSIIAPSLRKL